MATNVRRALAPRAPRVYRPFRKRSKAKFTIPVALVAGFFPLVANLNAGYKVAGVKGVADRLPGLVGIGTDGKWQGLSVMNERGTTAIVMGFVVHWLAGKFGLNRMIARAGVPFIRI